MNQTNSKLFGIDKSHFSFYMAKDYFERGLAAAKDANPLRFTFNEKQPTWKLSFPICTLSFSLELALKGFLADSQLKKIKDAKKGHSLVTIYNTIDATTRSAIENHFEICKGHNFKFFNIVLKSKSKEARHPKENTTQEKIFDALERCNEPYIQFRYLYEFKENVYYFDFNTVIKLIHSCLAIQANNLEIDLKFND